MMDALLRAEDCIRRDQLALAEIICRQALASQPGNARAMALLGAIAAKLQLRDEAIEHFQRALACDPALESARRQLAAAQAMAVQRFDRTPGLGDRFLVIKAWGYGFWADFSHLLGALLLAEITGRIPVTHWGGNSLYSADPNEDTFQAYFEPLSGTRLSDLLAMTDATYFPPKWANGNLLTDNNEKAFGRFSRMGAIYFLNRPEKIAVSDYYFGVVDLLPWIPKDHPLHGKSVDEAIHHLIDKYIRPKSHIVASVEKLYSDHIEQNPTIAVHVRGTDKYTENPDIDAVNASYFQLLDRQDKQWQLLLLTDDARVVEQYRSRYGSRVIVTDSQRSSNELGVFMSGKRELLGFEVMRDAYLALRCDKFIGNGQSGMSAMITLLKRWEKGDTILLRPATFLYTQNEFIYDPRFQATPMR